MRTLYPTPSYLFLFKLLLVIVLFFIYVKDRGLFVDGRTSKEKKVNRVASSLHKTALSLISYIIKETKACFQRESLFCAYLSPYCFRTSIYLLLFGMEIKQSLDGNPKRKTELDNFTKRGESISIPR